MPKTLSEHARLLKEALKQGDPQDWPCILRKDGRTREDDSVVYQGVSLPVTMHLAYPEGQGGHKDVLQEWTAVVVASATKLSKKQFETELQANEAVEQMLRATAKQRRGFKHSVQVTTLDVALPRTRKGRPKAGELTPSRKVYQVNVQFEPDEQNRDEQAQMAGLFVLVSSRKVKEFSMSWVLDTYREQNQVEDGFRWIKAYGTPARSKEWLENVDAHKLRCECGLVRTITLTLTLTTTSTFQPEP